MSVRFQRAVAVMVVGPILGLSGCTPAPAPVVEASTEGPFIKLSPPAPRPHRVDPCKAAKPDLPPERKEALFKQFTAEHAGDPALLAVADTAPAPNACKQGAH